MTRTASEMALAPIKAGASWDLIAAGFPPGVNVAYAIHAGFDVAERGGRAPVTIFIDVEGDSPKEFFFFADFDRFPLWGDYQSRALSGADGTLSLNLGLIRCQVTGSNGATVDSSCFLDASSALVATLASTSPWLEAPRCE